MRSFFPSISHQDKVGLKRHKRVCTSPTLKKMRSLITIAFMAFFFPVLTNALFSSTLFPLIISFFPSSLLCCFISAETNLAMEIGQRFKTAVFCSSLETDSLSSSDELPETHFFEKFLETVGIADPEDILNTCDLFDDLAKKAEDLHVFEQEHPNTVKFIRENSEDLIKLVCSAPAEREAVPLSLLSSILNIPEDMIVDEYLRLSDEAMQEEMMRPKDSFPKLPSAEGSSFSRLSAALAEDTVNQEATATHSSSSRFGSVNWTRVVTFTFITAVGLAVGYFYGPSIACAAKDTVRGIVKNLPSTIDKAPYE